MPEAAKGTSAASAKAFVRYYVDAINYASGTGDTAPIKNSSASDCVSCRDVAVAIDRIYASGSHLDGGGWAVRTLAPIPGQQARRPIIQAAIQVRPQRKISNTGHIERRQGGRKLFIFTLVRGSDGWSVASLEQSA
jgi:hypothetical protein